MNFIERFFNDIKIIFLTNKIGYLEKIFVSIFCFLTIYLLYHAVTDPYLSSLNKAEIKVGKIANFKSTETHKRTICEFDLITNNQTTHYLDGRCNYGVIMQNKDNVKIWSKKYGNNLNKPYQIYALEKTHRQKLFGTDQYMKKFENTFLVDIIFNFGYVFLFMYITIVIVFEIEKKKFNNENLTLKDKKWL